jgi:hypothetical protein
MENCWVAGTGHVMKRACVRQLGPIKPKQSFPNYCVQLAAAGWINGWYYPFIYMENMDDPRSTHTRMTSDAQFAANKSLSADRFGIRTLADFRQRQRMLALEIQTASNDARRYLGWRRKLRQLTHLISKARRPTPRWVAQ